MNGSGGYQIGDIVDSDTGYLAGFSLYLGALVVFRLFFATLYICKWKFLYNCNSKYKVRRRNLTEDFKDIKKTHREGESTDDEIIEEELNKVYESNRDHIRGRVELSQH